jgi:hypothetical protein
MKTEIADGIFFADFFVVAAIVVVVVVVFIFVENVIFV